MSKFRSVFCAVAIASLMTGSLMAQGLTGQISGSVNDSTGSAVVGAEVVLTNQGTGATRQISSDQSGNFLFAQLLAGNYTLTITSAGFKKHEEKDVVLSSSERAVVRPITLELGAISESISVTAESAKLQTQSAERAGTLSSNMIVETPQKGRHFLGLLSLMPGVINNNNFEGPARRHRQHPSKRQPRGIAHRDIGRRAECRHRQPAGADLAARARVDR
jgi:hypothetical protein